MPEGSIYPSHPYLQVTFKLIERKWRLGITKLRLIGRQGL
jgi:hypothetical protein